MISHWVTAPNTRCRRAGHVALEDLGRLGPATATARGAVSQRVQDAAPPAVAVPQEEEREQGGEEEHDPEEGAALLTRAATFAISAVPEPPGDVDRRVADPALTAPPMDFDDLAQRADHGRTVSATMPTTRRTDRPVVARAARPYDIPRACRRPATGPSVAARTVARTIGTMTVGTATATCDHEPGSPARPGRASSTGRAGRARWGPCRRPSGAPGCIRAGRPPA